MPLCRFSIFDDTGRASVTFFHNKYVARRIARGEEYCFFGRISVRGSLRSLTNPVFCAVRDMAREMGRILPVYPTTQGLPQRLLRDWVAAALAQCVDAQREVLPPEILTRHGLCALPDALRTLHAPVDWDGLSGARRRLVFGELLLFALATGQLGRVSRSVPGVHIALPNMEDFFATLPYPPTGAQRRAIAEITDDLQSGRRMRRLLQGDVGSGKTLVAAAALWAVRQSGMQSALMAPTELLARQHFDSLSALFAPLGVRCALLVSALPQSQKKAVHQALAAGEIDVLIGTHALLSEQVRFARAGLFVVDEQHRFGVAQRAALGQKAAQAHMLVLSATPIPRTLSLILFGDLALSVLDELPPGRSPVQTYAIGADKRARALAFVQKQVDEGGQCYIVCPRIAATEQDEERPLPSAEEYAAALARAMPRLRIGVVHGKCRPAETRAVMEAFHAGALDVLVATTVIEVGVNAPNASLMLIEHADRFGLSQLHQLRGRVGRGTRQSYCILLAGSGGDVARACLQVLQDSQDGFFIAREDLRLRGPGDFLGQRQHGLPAFSVADLHNDLDLLTLAQEEAQALLDTDPTLAHVPDLAAAVAALLATVPQEETNGNC